MGSPVGGGVVRKRRELIIVACAANRTTNVSNVSPIAQSLYRLHPLGSEVAVGSFKIYSSGDVDGTLGLSAL